MNGRSLGQVILGHMKKGRFTILPQKYFRESVYVSPSIKHIDNWASSLNYRSLSLRVLFTFCNAE